MSKKIETIAVHAGRADFRQINAHAAPIDLSSTYPISDLQSGTESFDALVAGEATASNPIYARLYNPTVARAESAVAELEGTQACVGFSSGMAAMTAVLLAVREKGQHIVACRPIYGTGDHLLSSDLLGMHTTWCEPSEIANAIRPDTALVVIETPGNPTLNLVDIAAVVKAAGDVPVLVDSTFATPILQRPAEFGAALVLHSATKFLGGHGDVIAGMICCSEAWAKRIRQVRIVTGALLHPLAAFLLMRGLPTLSLRVLKAQDNAIKITERLLEHKAVCNVRFPGLPSHLNSHLVGSQMAGPGTLVCFDLRGGHAAASLLMQSVKMITPAVSLGSTDTLIQHPAGLTHRVVAEDARIACGIAEGTVRLSLGIESVDDIWADLCAALDLCLQQQPSIAA